MKNLLIALVCGLTLQISSIALADPPPLEAYGNLPYFSSAEISPDGTMVAVIANIDDGTTRLLVFKTGGELVKQVGIGEIKARGVSFYSDDHIILRASETTRTWGFRGDYEYSAAFSINLKTGKVVQLLTRGEDLFPAQSGLGQIVGGGPDNDTVLMPAYVGEVGADPSYDLMRVDLDTGFGRIQRRGRKDGIDWFTDGKGGALVRESYDNSRDTYRIQHRKKGKWVTVYEEKDTKLLPFAISGVMPDNSGIVFVKASRHSDGFDQLMKMDFNGEITGPVLARENREIDVLYTDDERRVLGVRYAGIEPTYEFLDPKLEASHKKVAELLPNATIYLDSWSKDRSTVLYNIFDAGTGDIWITHQEGSDRVTSVGNNRPNISLTDIGTVAAISYKARDGLDINAIVTLPQTFNFEAPEPSPLIVLPHGGPASYDRMDFDWMAQFFSSRGYVVFQPNFRGSTGFGKAFTDSGRGEWGGKMQDDITDGVEALATAGYADKSNVCIIGASYGGYAALAGATFTPELYKCVVAIAPVSDLNRMLADEKRERGGDHWVVDYWEGLMADGDARRKKLDEISPSKAADRVQAPILLLHGDDDTVVPIEQSTIMKRALERAGKDVTFLKLKGEDHWLSVAETRLQLLKEIDTFLKQHMPVTP